MREHLTGSIAKKQNYRIICISGSKRKEHVTGKGYAIKKGWERGGWREGINVEVSQEILSDICDRMSNISTIFFIICARQSPTPHPQTPSLHVYAQTSAYYCINSMKCN